jgi:hypothetical protein
MVGHEMVGAVALHTLLQQAMCCWVSTNRPLGSTRACCAKLGENDSSECSACTYSLC